MAQSGEDSGFILQVVVYFLLVVAFLLLALFYVTVFFGPPSTGMEPHANTHNNGNPWVHAGWTARLSSCLRRFLKIGAYERDILGALPVQEMQPLQGPVTVHRGQAEDHSGAFRTMARILWWGCIAGRPTGRKPSPGTGTSSRTGVRPRVPGWH